MSKWRVTVLDTMQADMIKQSCCFLQSGTYYLLNKRWEEIKEGDRPGEREGAGEHEEGGTHRRKEEKQVESKTIRTQEHKKRI